MAACVPVLQIVDVYCWLLAFFVKVGVMLVSEN